MAQGLGQGKRIFPPSSPRIRDRDEGIWAVRALSELRRSEQLLYLGTGEAAVDVDTARRIEDVEVAVATILL